METLRQIYTILVANRGEIAARIIRSCQKMGIATIAVFSEADRHAPYVEQADRAVYLGPSEPARSYLDQEKIIRVAKQYGADAIHPGYGFLSENADFAEYCQREDIIFIGPNVAAIRQMGSKSAAKALMQSHDVPTIPGYQGEDQSYERIRKEAEGIGFPVLLKAAAGGGGKGMRIVRAAADLLPAFDAAKREAINAFGDDELIIEKYISSGRHIEFQIFGDQHQNVIHVLERECTIQRRYQKIIEESPSPVLTPALREEMGRSAVAAARALHYDNAGTVEFIFDEANGAYYFLEVNTRLQVEHPVTEMITGLDLVELQIRVATGLPLPLTQTDVQANGYAIEARLYAEDPTNDFLPGSGTVVRWRVPAVAGLRTETAVRSGSEISIYYDPMIAKLVVWDATRGGALRKLRYTLAHLKCLGLRTNQALLAAILAEPNFIAGRYDTHYIERNLGRLNASAGSESRIHHALIAATLLQWQGRKNERNLLVGLPAGWRNNYYQPLFDTYRYNDEEIQLSYRYAGGVFIVSVSERQYTVRLVACRNDGQLVIDVDGVRTAFTLARNGSDFHVHDGTAGSIELSLQDKFPRADADEVAGGYQAPMPSQVIQVLVAIGTSVEAGDPLIVLSSMKMENTIAATAAGTVTDIFVADNENIAAGQILLKIDEPA